MAKIFEGSDVSLIANARLPFAITLTRRGVDLSTATFVGHVRATPNQSNAISPLAVFTFGGVTLTTDESWVVGGVTKTGPVSRLRASLSEVQIRALADAFPMPDPEDQIALYFDFQQSISGLKTLLTRGRFIIQWGATNG